MRTYGQYCAVAKALDVIGDRWTLLIVRELILQGACRYTDLRNGLPGIATNLLAERLRELERAGLIQSEVAPPPVATTLFSLTDRGRELEPVLRELGKWGAPFMPEGPGGDAFRTHWLGFPMSLFLHSPPDQPPVTIELRAGAEAVTVENASGVVRMHQGPSDSPDLMLSGSPQLILGALSGELSLDRASSMGLEVEGDPTALTRLQRQPA